MNYPIDTRKFERFVTFGKKKKGPFKICTTYKTKFTDFSDVCDYVYHQWHYGSIKNVLSAPEELRQIYISFQLMFRVH